MAGDIFTLDENNNAAVRTVSVNAGESETNSPVIFTTDENGNACVRVIVSGGSIDEDRVIIKSAEIPAASADELGKFYCYSGTTNANYTHGYIYECVASSTYYTANIAFEQSTFASESFEKAGQLIVDAGVTDPTQVTGGTMTYALAGNLWSIVFTDGNGNALNTAYNIYTDDLEQDYDILPVIDPSEFTDGQVVNMLINNIEAHQNYSWERLDVQPAAKLGRYLSGWNCATGLAMTNPQESPYEYTTGDYYIVGTVATGGASNYRPDGSQYVIGQASTTVETSTVTVNDTYLYDGTNWTLLKTGSTVTSVNGQVGDVTVQETLVSGTNIKTINGNSVLGSGNMQVSGFLPFPAGWTTNSTTKALCDDIAADASTVKGSAFLGEVTCSDLPASIGNSEINVYINDGTTVANKVIILELTSGNVAPYRWIYVYWDGGSNVSGWKTWQEPLVSGTNIKTINGSSILGSGDLSVGGGSLPSQTGQSGKFLTTDGTDTSWGSIPFPVSSVNSKTGAVTLTASDVGALPDNTHIPADPVQADWNEADSNALDYIKNKPTIPAAQVNSDWNANSGVAEILNKPTLGTAASADTTDFATAAQGALAATAVQPSDLATVATTGSYNDLSNKPTIPAAQVNSDWNASSGVAQILNKPTLGTMASESASDYTPTSGLATVATTGAYSDLSGTPTIPEAIQVSTMPTAAAGEVGKVYQFIGTTDANYIHGYFYECVSDGQQPATYSWTAVQVQASSGGLPTQTGNAGKFLTTDGTNASWTTATTTTVPATMPELTVVGWSSNTQTVSVQGVSSSNTVLVAPAPSSNADYVSAGILCTAQATNSLTFTCQTVPSNAITVNVVILG